MLHISQMSEALIEYIDKNTFLAPEYKFNTNKCFWEKVEQLKQICIEINEEQGKIDDIFKQKVRKLSQGKRNAGTPSNPDYTGLNRVIDKAKTMFKLNTDFDNIVIGFDNIVIEWLKTRYIEVESLLLFLSRHLDQYKDKIASIGSNTTCPKLNF